MCLSWLIWNSWDTEECFDQILGLCWAVCILGSPWLACWCWVVFREGLLVNLNIGWMALFYFLLHQSNSYLNKWMIYIKNGYDMNNYEHMTLWQP